VKFLETEDEQRDLKTGDEHRDKDGGETVMSGQVGFMTAVKS
jgi:hypothetical protein